MKVTFGIRKKIALSFAAGFFVIAVSAAGTSVQRADEAQTKLGEILAAMQEIRSINLRIDDATQHHQSAMLGIRTKASNIGETAQEIDLLAQLLSDSATQLEQRATTLNTQLAELHY